METASSADHGGRIALGFVLVPPAAGVATLGVQLLFRLAAGLTGWAIPGIAPLSAAIAIGAFAVFVAIPSTALVAAPLFTYLQRRQRVTLTAALATGVCCAVGTYVLFAL